MDKRNQQPINRNKFSNSDSFESQNSQVMRRSSENQERDKWRRSFEDQERDKSVYKYLLECLTDLGINEGEANPKPNESSIAKQWGQTNNRIFIRRVLRSVLPQYYEENEKDLEQPVPGLTIGKLVQILTAIQDYWEKKRLPTLEAQIPRILTRSEKLRAFRTFYQLSIAEKEKLNFSIHPGETLLQQLLEIVTDTVKGLKYEDIIPFYKGAINIYHQLKQAEFINQQDLEKTTYTEIVKYQVENLIREHYQGLDTTQKNNKTDDLVNKVHREINRLELQCGIRQIKSLLKDTENVNESHTNTDFLPHAFIEHLTRSIVENEILTDEFPINIKHIEIEKTKPLPLYLKEEDYQNGLLNPQFIDEKEDIEDINGLKKQFAYKLKVHFYVRYPDNYAPIFGEEDAQTSYFSFRERKLEFFEEITGIGSPIYHIIAAINRVILWDIPELIDYFPVARSIVSHHDFFGSPSLIRSYTLVNLCKKDDIENALKENKTYDQVLSNYEPAYGEYCGFDLVEVAAKAGLHARLRAIKQTGINPVKYLTQLCYRVEELNAFRKAESYLNFYPFSLKAMEGYLNQTIFRDRYRIVNNQYNFLEKDIDRPWTSVAYDAHLTITEAYLKEGLYQIAKKYLDVLKSHIENAKKGKNYFFGDLLLVKYELCQFRYHYLTDLQDDSDSEIPQLHLERSSAIRAATESLNYAEEYLKKLLRKYYVIRASAQSNFHPFFYLFSRIYAHRAKLYIFTSSYTDLPSRRFNGFIEPVRLFEKARIYAARDGSPVLYSSWTAYQSLCYIMVAYLGDYEPLPHQKFSRKECIDWAKRLIEHALICFHKYGKLCYQQIKDNGGKITNNIRNKKYYESYGNIQVQVVPLIQELKESSEEDQKIYDHEKNVINIDFSILKKICPDDEQSIYLFGTYSSIILFAMGMLELCDDEKQESKLKSRIDKAFKNFTYCSAIAEDGAVSGNKENRDPDDEKVYLERIFADGDELVRGLYPHRLTQFADLGKIWAATCKVILHLYHSDTDWQEIDKLLERLPNSPTKPVLHNAYRQKRYNGHLESHCDRLVEYFKQLKDKKLNTTKLIDIRNKVVRDVFKIMRGESDVKP
ncbi:MAG: HypX (modular protein) [Hapalosiphonaceae cyanobacterium JJU2]|nr:MAG: HypX (modular protein) [Hapalosiphonaceae cyanobacterium JJU2]